MRKGLVLLVAAALLMATGTEATAKKWWQVETDSATTAEVRGVFVDRLREHRRDVRLHLAKVHRAAVEARQAAAAAAAALEATHDTWTAPTASDYSGCLSADQVAGYARGAGFPEDAIATMVAYAYRESHYCPGAVNSSSGACGLWQLYPCYGGSAWLDPSTNARYAYAKYAASGFAPWGG